MEINSHTRSVFVLLSMTQQKFYI